MENLIKLREISQVPYKTLSKLLNVTVYIYKTYEEKRMFLPPEVSIMLSRMFRIDSEKITNSDLSFSDSDLEQLKMISHMNDEEKLLYLASGILEKDEKINYRTIRKVRISISLSMKSGDSNRNE